MLKESVRILKDLYESLRVGHATDADRPLLARILKVPSESLRRNQSEFESAQES